MKIENSFFKGPQDLIDKILSLDLMTTYFDMYGIVYVDEIEADFYDYPLLCKIIDEGDHPSFYEVIFHTASHTLYRTIREAINDRENVKIQ